MIAILPRKIRYGNRLYFIISTAWNYCITRTLGLQIIIRGREHLPLYPSTPSVFVMNHASSLDIPLIEEVVRTYPHIWISQNKFGKIPFFGFLLKRMHILVDRSDSRSSAQALIRLCSYAQESGSHVLIFPEGTRTKDGKLTDFLKGFVLIVKRLRRPLIPIAIQGSHKVMPSGSWWVDHTKAPLVLTIGKPLYLEAEESDEHFSKRVHAWFDQIMHSKVI